MPVGKAVSARVTAGRVVSTSWCRASTRSTRRGSVTTCSATSSSGSTSTAPSPTSSPSCTSCSASIRSRSRTPSISASAPSSTTTATTSSSCSTAPGATAPGPASRCARCTCSSRASTSSRSTATRCPRSTQQREQLDGRVAAQRAVPALPGPGRARRQLLPAALGDMDDEIDELEAAVLARPTDQQLAAAVLAQAPARRDAQGGDAAARPVRPLGRPDRRAPRARARRARLLPRRLRPPDPDQRPDRLLSRPPVRRHRPLPLDGQQPPERRDEAAHRDRDDLPAAGVHHRLLRPELRLHGHRLIRAEWTFWVLGVGSMLATLAGLLLFFRRKSWL